MPNAHVLLFDGYADWEIGYALAEIKRIGGMEVTTVGLTNNQVVSMGGLQVIPHMALADVEITEVSIFILPGGTFWESSYQLSEIIHFLQLLAAKDIPIAAICAATTVLAKAGLLHGTNHTSNSQAYLCAMAADYCEQETYIDTPACRDRHIITASGLGAIDFTLEILHELEIATPQMRSIWYDAFKHGIYNP